MQELETETYYVSVDSPIVIKLNWNSSWYVKNFGIDDDLENGMKHITKLLLSKTGASFCYVHYDTVIIVFAGETTRYMAGKLQSMVSTLSSLCTGWLFETFLRNKTSLLGEMHPPTFNAKIIIPEDMYELIDYLNWVIGTYLNNSTLLLSHTFLPRDETKGKGVNVVKDMLLNKGISWDDMPKFFKEGAFLAYDNTRENPLYDMFHGELPTKVKNKRKVLFDGDTPQIKQY